MIVGWLKALLFVVGGLTAAAGTAYVTGLLDPWLASPPPVVAALPEQPAARPPVSEPPRENAVPAPEPVQEEAEEPAAGAPADPQTTDKQDRIVPPSFDLLRVEPDGSIVVAGRAPARSRVEVLTGDEVLAATDAGEIGDFAAVLDDPLAPGDYQLVLRATTQDNQVATSAETAIVSIPDTTDGDVLALVEAPGEPSKLITVPEAVVPSDDVAAATEDDPTTEAGTADVEQAPDVADAEELPTGDEAAADGHEQAAAAGDAQGQDDQALASAEEGAAAGETDAAGAQQPDVTQAEELPSTEGSAQDEQQAADSAEDGATPDQAVAEGSDDAAPEPDTQSEMAALPQGRDQAEEAAGDEPAAGAAEQPATAVDVVVEAVEIEGGTIFVAGRAEAGRTVRVYANEMLLGEVRVSEGGRFLVEARRDLAVGDYIIRADVIAADGTVLSRAAVPFEREPGESIAAVAAPAPVATEEPQAPAADQPAAAATEEPAAQDAVPDAAAVPPAPADVASSDAAPEPGAAQEAAGEMAAAPADAAQQPASPAVPSDEAASSDESGAVGQEMASAPMAPDAAEEVPQGETEVAAASPGVETEVTAAPLQRADGAVIIRRGDNLWRISRRVYGKGVRFSTIYLANRDQIEDPDRIWPGQVFAVPEETAEGEAADMEAIGEQAVSPETESQIIR